MTKDEILELMTNGLFQGLPVNGRLEETNTSWVILSEKFVFKIKKPLKLSFLDYSSLELRKLYCEKELELNKRFSPIYISVMPITKSQDHWMIGESRGEIIDYTVCMLKMDAEKRMDLLLGLNKVKEVQVVKLAKHVADFHLKAKVIQKGVYVNSFSVIFNDLESVSEFISHNLGKMYIQKIASLINWSDQFVFEHIKVFQDRMKRGFFRDIHGDLHSRNIFLYEDPVIFDCIEFEESFRQIDVLYEVAFLCMDLENFGKRDFSDLFLKSYLQVFNCMQSPKGMRIFNYYKCLRANIRAKVNFLDADTEPDLKIKKEKIESGKKYMDLALYYMDLES